MLDKQIQNFRRYQSQNSFHVVPKKKKSESIKLVSVSFLTTVCMCHTATILDSITGQYTENTAPLSDNIRKYWKIIE